MLIPMDKTHGSINGSDVDVWDARTEMKYKWAYNVQNDGRNTSVSVFCAERKWALRVRCILFGNI